jgi:hypothetical protein
MKVTIITLYRGEECETYTGAVEGHLTDEQCKEVADKLELVTEDGEALDQVGFVFVEISKEIPKNLTNAMPDMYTFDGCEEDDSEDEDEDDLEDEDDE